MINSNNILSLINKVIQPNIKIIVLLLIIVILMFQYLDANIIFILSFILTVIIYHKELLNILNDIQKNETPTERIIEDNKRFKKENYYDEEINEILHKFKKYRKYNTNAYDDGLKEFKMFMFLIHDLEKIDISHPKQYFENAEIHLKNSLNHFQSISISVPEETFNKTLKYNKFETTKLGNKIGKLCKRLHKHCYYLLYNLSLRLNEIWENEPDIYMSQITMNTDNVEPNSNINTNYEMY